MYVSAYSHSIRKTWSIGEKHAFLISRFLVKRTESVTSAVTTESEGRPRPLRIAVARSISDHEAGGYQKAIHFDSQSDPGRIRSRFAVSRGVAGYSARDGDFIGHDPGGAFNG